MMDNPDQTWAARAACASEAPDQLFGKGAEQRDARTLCFYAAREESALPGLIQRTLRHYLAYQAQAISLAGGVAGALEAPIKSATAGKFSFTAGVGENAHCPAAAALLPLLVSYARCD